jgi:hypothetical protein
VEQFFDWLDELLHHSREWKNCPVTYDQDFELFRQLLLGIAPERQYGTDKVNTALAKENIVLAEIKHSTEEDKHSTDEGTTLYWTPRQIIS